MLRMYLPMVLIAIFAGWVLYHIFIKRDLKQKKMQLYLGLTFTGVWILIYYFLIR
jgi:hypothetical protein